MRLFSLPLEIVARPGGGGEAAFNLAESGGIPERWRGRSASRGVVGFRRGGEAAFNLAESGEIPEVPEIPSKKTGGGDDFSFLG